MGRIRTIGEKGPAETPLSYRAAREVARGLRARGWAASARFCQGRTPADVAKILVPVTAAGAREHLAEEIAVMAGLMPAEAAQG
jgi:hypothetical protein